MANAASSTANILCFPLSTLHLSLLVQWNTNDSWVTSYDSCKAMLFSRHAEVTKKIDIQLRGISAIAQVVCRGTGALSPTQQRPSGCSCSNTLPLSRRNAEHIPTEVSVDKECIRGKLGPTRDEEYTLATEMHQEKHDYINEYM